MAWVILTDLLFRCEMCEYVKSRFLCESSPFQTFHAQLFFVSTEKVEVGQDYGNLKLACFPLLLLNCEL